MPDDSLEQFKKQNRITPPTDSVGGVGSIDDAQRASAIKAGASKLNIDPIDYATAMSYESGKTFDPWAKGPVTKWGQHRGTIQYGEPQQQTYGVRPDQSFEDQVTNSNVKYLKDAGVKPGMSFAQIYAAINGGSPYKDLNTPDANTGRTIADNIRIAQEEHRPYVMKRFGQYLAGDTEPKGFDDLRASILGPRKLKPLPNPGTGTGPTFPGQSPPLPSIGQPQPSDQSAPQGQISSDQPPPPISAVPPVVPVARPKTPLEIVKTGPGSTVEQAPTPEYQNFLKQGGLDDDEQSRNAFQMMNRATAEQNQKDQQGFQRQQAPVQQPQVGQPQPQPAQPQTQDQTPENPEYATVHWMAGGNAKKQALDDAASQLASRLGVDYGIVRQKLENAHFKEGEFLQDAAEQQRKAGEPLQIGLDPNAVREVKAQDAELKRRQAGSDEFLQEQESQNPNRSPFAQKIDADSKAGLIDPNQAQGALAKEDDAYSKWLKETGYTDDQYRNDHSQEYQSDVARVMKDFGSFSNLQETRNQSSEYYKDKPYSQILGLGPDYQKATSAANLYDRTDRLSDQQRDAAKAGGTLLKMADQNGPGSFGSQFITSAVQDLSRLGAGVTRAAKYVNPLFALSAWATGTDPVETTAQSLEKFSKGAQIVGETSKNDATVFGYYSGLGGRAIGGLPGLVVSTIGAGGNPILGFGLHSLLSNTDKPIAEQVQGTTKEMLIGSVFSGAGAIADFAGSAAARKFLTPEVVDALNSPEAETEFTDSILKKGRSIQTLVERGETEGERAAAQNRLDAFLKKYDMDIEDLDGNKPPEMNPVLRRAMQQATVAKAIAEKGTSIGLVAATGYTASRLEGESEKKSLEQAILWGAMDAVMSVRGKDADSPWTDEDIEAADGRVVRVPDAKGKPHDVMLIADGQKLLGSDVTGKLPPDVVDAQVLPKPGETSIKPPSENEPKPEETGTSTAKSGSNVAVPETKPAENSFLPTLTPEEKGQITSEPKGFDELKADVLSEKPNETQTPISKPPASVDKGQNVPAPEANAPEKQPVKEAPEIIGNKPLEPSDISTGTKTPVEKPKPPVRVQGIQLNPKEENIVNPIDRSLPQQKKVDALVKLSKENEPVLQKVVDRIKNEVGIDSKLSFKEPEKILKKANRPIIKAAKPYFDVEHVRDSLRFMASMNNFEDAEKIKKIFNEEGIKPVKLDTEKMLRPKDWGWRFFAYDLKLPNGQLVEFYAPLKELNSKDVKDPNHDLFEKWRDMSEEDILKSGKWKQYRRDQKKSYDRYQAAWESALSRLGLDDKAAEASWNKVAARLGSNTGEKLSMESSAVATPRLQEPSSNIAAKSSESTEMRPESGSSETETFQSGSLRSKTNAAIESPSNESITREGKRPEFSTNPNDLREGDIFVWNGNRVRAEKIERDESGNILHVKGAHLPAKGKARLGTMSISNRPGSTVKLSDPERGFVITEDKAEEPKKPAGKLKTLAADDTISANGKFYKVLRFTKAGVATEKIGEMEPFEGPRSRLFSFDDIAKMGFSIPPEGPEKTATIEPIPAKTLSPAEKKRIAAIDKELLGLSGAFTTLTDAGMSGGEVMRQMRDLRHEKEVIEGKAEPVKKEGNQEQLETPKKSPDLSSFESQAATEFEEDFEKLLGFTDELEGIAKAIGSEFGDLGNLKKVVEQEAPKVDAEKYDRLKPQFEKAQKYFEKRASEGQRPMFMLLETLHKKFGMSPETIRNLKPYIVRYIAEQKAIEKGISIDNGTIINPEAENGAQRTEPNRDGETGDVVESAGNVPRAGEVGGSGKGLPAESASGPRSLPSNAKPGNGSSVDVEQAGSEPVSGRQPTGEPGLEYRDDSGNRVSPIARRDYIAEPGSLTREGSWKTAAKNNLDAIELAKKIESEDRVATPEEQAVLVKFVGWGASELANNIFKDPDGYQIKPDWKPLAERLNQVLTPEEIKTASRSTQYAHYTSEKVIRGIWSAIEQFGFEKGSILEPGMGIGLFAVAAPKKLIENSAYTGIEMDAMTARIAKLLLPDQAAIENDFIKQKIPKNHFDVAIGNPPFARTKILADREYKKHQFSLHDYFFAKSLDAVRPGGLMVFVTSRYTMDKMGDKAREYMADKADLLGAIRLPQTAFKQNAGTDVVTDVLFFRKRMAGEEPGGVPWLGHKEVTATNKYDKEHTGLVNEYFADHPEMVLGSHSFAGEMRSGDNEYTVLPKEGDIEQQFEEAVKNLPKAVFAKQGKTQEIVKATAERDWNPKATKEGSLYIHDDGRLMIKEGGSGVEVATRQKLTPKDEKWLKSYVGLRNALKQAQYDQLHAEDREMEESRPATMAAVEKWLDGIAPDMPNERKTEFLAKQPDDEFIKNVGTAAANSPGLSPRDIALGIKNVLGLDRVSLFPDTRPKVGNWEDSLAELNKVYDKFVKDNGHILAFVDRERTKADEDGNQITTVTRSFKNEKLLSNDIENALVWTLEKITDDGQIVKSGWLKQRTIKPPEPPKIENLNDALMVSLDTLGKLSIPHVTELVQPVKKMTEDEVVKELGDLIYEEPGGGWAMADEYLSGNVKDKLEVAEAAASDPRYRRNVEALQKVQPLPLSPERITVQLGASWVPPEMVSQFANEVLGVPKPKKKYYYSDEPDPLVSFDVGSGKWKVSGASGKGSQSRRDATKEWGTKDRSPEEILEAALNSESVTIMAEDAGPPRRKYVDKDAVAAVQAKIEKMNQAFKPWLFSDPKRSKEMTDLYNRKMNVLAERQFDGRHLTTPGLSMKYKLYPHQKRAVWRQIQTGNTYLAHAVGAGKTLEMIVGAMEQRRLGQLSKPMFTVPNHMLKQFSSEFLDAYPLANIMVADEQNFHTDNRRRFVAQAALNDLDAVILTHSAFGLLRSSEESARAVLEDLLSEMYAMKDELTVGEDSKGNAVGETMADTSTIKRIEQRIEAIEQKFYGRMNSNRDNVLDFEELGVDFLYVDEAHEFRKLDFVTNQTNLKGIDPSGSMRALDLLVKSRWLDKQRPGRSMVLASGTPITNTMAELYSIQRFLGHRDLLEDGLDSFDAWAKQFGQVEEKIEANAAGGYKPVKRFRKIVNTGVLMQRVRRFMDVLTLPQLGDLIRLPTIKLNSKGHHAAEVVVTEPYPELKAYLLSELAERIRKSEAWKPTFTQKYNPDPMIAIIGDGQLAAFDMRFIDPKLPSNPASKLNRMADGIIDSYHKYNDIEYRNKDTGEAYPIKGAAHIVFSYGGFGEQVAANRGFDARKALRQRLVAAGIPNEEIAFISDYKTSSAKQSLFKEVREGKKKILIGSPKNMGTGVNAQLRLKTLHYGMAPWYPADIEQPHGRIVRQGNQNDEVELYWYAAKGTYDETQWGMLSDKGKMIEDAMSGNYDGDVEDVTESSQYAMASALASGDPRALRFAELRGLVEKYTRLEQNYHTTRINFDRELRDINSQWYGIPRKQSDIKEFSEVMALVPGGVNKDNFHLQIGKEVFDKEADKNQAEIGTVLKDAWAKAVKSSKKEAIAAKKPVAVEIAKFQGQFPVIAEVSAGRSGIETALGLRVGGMLIKLHDVYSVGEDKIGDISESGLISRINNAINGLPEKKAKAEQELAELEQKKKEIQLALAKPFEYEDELQKARAEANQLALEMMGQGIEMTPAYVTANEIEAVQKAYGLKKSKKAATQQFEDQDIEPHQLAKTLEEDEQTESDRQTVQEMRNLQHVPFDELLAKNPKAELVDGQIKADAVSHEIFRRAFEQAKIERGQMRLGSTKAEDMFSGQFMDPQFVSRTRQVLLDKAAEATDKGYTPEETKTLETFAHLLDASAKANGGTAIVYVFEHALPHEIFHQADYMGSLEKTVLSRHTDEYKSILDNHPVTRLLWNQHFSNINTYSRQKSVKVQRALLRAEIPPLLLELTDKQLSDYGITPDQRDDYLLTWFKGYVAKNGIDSLQHFDKEQLHVEKYINAAKAAFGKSETGEAGQTSSINGPPQHPGEATDTASPEEEHARGNKPDENSGRPLSETRIDREDGQSVTGIRNSLTDLERAKRGLPLAMEPARRAFGQVWDSVMAELDNHPETAKELVDDLRGNERPLTDREDALLLHRQIELQGEHDRTLEELNQAGDDVHKVASVSAREAALSDELQDIYKIIERAGTLNAQGLAARRMLVREDYSLSKMVLMKRAANNNRDLTSKELADLTELQKQIAETQKNFDDYVAKADERIAELNAQRSIEAITSPHILGIAQKLVDNLETQANKARERLKSRGVMMQAGLNPLDMKDLAIIGASHIAHAGLDFAKWSSRFVSDVGAWVEPHLGDIWSASQKTIARSKLPTEPKERKPRTPKSPIESIEAKIKAGRGDAIYGDVNKLAKEYVAKGIVDRTELIDAIHDALKHIDPTITRRDTMDAISGYGRFKQLSKNEVDVILRDLKGQMQQLGKIEDMAEGNAPKKTGFERRPVTDEERRLIKQVEEDKRKGGYNVTDPATQLRTALQAVKTRLANQIKDLELQITSRQKIVKNKTALVYDDQANELVARRDELKTQFYEMFGKPGMTDEQRLRAWKTRTSSRIKDLEQRIADKDYAARAKRPPVQLDEKGLEIQEKAQRLKNKFAHDLAADRLSKRNLGEKVADGIVEYTRAAILSSPVVFAKLGAAAFERLGFTPLEELAGSLYSPFIPGVAKRAPRHGGMNVKAEAKALTSVLMKGIKDAKDSLTTGHTQLDVLYGKDKIEANIIPLLPYIGRAHKMMKAPVARSEFERSLEKRIAHAMANGIDPLDPLVMSRLAHLAYQDSQRAIFQQDNFVTDAYRRFLSRFEQRDKVTGKPTVLGKTASTLLRGGLLPVVKVPTNIVGETIEYATGLLSGGARLGRAYKNGVNNLSEEEADLIMRHLKKGLIGAAILLLGYLLGGEDQEAIGGYYQPGEKRKPTDVKAGNIRVFGVEVPSYLLHNPALEVLQIGATIRRVSDAIVSKAIEPSSLMTELDYGGPGTEFIDHGKHYTLESIERDKNGKPAKLVAIDKETGNEHRLDVNSLKPSVESKKGWTPAVIAAGLGLAEETPYVKEMFELDKITDPNKRDEFLDSFVRDRFIPQLSQWAAARMDRNAEGEQIKRKPENFGQTLEMGIPGLRKNVPEKKANKQMDLDQLETLYKTASDSERPHILNQMSYKMKTDQKEGNLDENQRQRLEQLGASIPGDVQIPDGVQKELDRFNIKVPDVGEDLTLGKGGARTKLSEGEYENYRRGALTNIYHAVEDLMKTDSYQKATDDQKEALIHRMINKGRDRQQKVTKRDLIQGVGK